MVSRRLYPISNLFSFKNRSNLAGIPSDYRRANVDKMRFTHRYNHRFIYCSVFFRVETRKFCIIIIYTVSVPLAYLVVTLLEGHCVVYLVYVLAQWDFSAFVNPMSNYPGIPSSPGSTSGQARPQVVTDL